MEEKNSNQKQSGKSASTRRVKFIAGYQVELEGNTLIKKIKEKNQ